MHVYKVHAAIYQNYEIHGPWIRGTGPRMGMIWPFSENICYLTEIFFSTPIYIRANWTHSYDLNESPGADSGFKIRGGASFRQRSEDRLEAPSGSRANAYWGSRG